MCLHDNFSKASVTLECEACHHLDDPDQTFYSSILIVSVLHVFPLKWLYIVGGGGRLPSFIVGAGCSKPAGGCGGLEVGGGAQDQVLPVINSCCHTRTKSRPCWRENSSNKEIAEIEVVVRGG